MAPLVYFITGANQGIGYEVVRILSERLGDQAIILLGTRSIDNGKAALVTMQEANGSFNYANVRLLEIDEFRLDPAHDHPDIKTVIVCPGHCATELSAYRGARTPTQGAESVVFPLFHPNESKAGRFYRDGIELAFDVPMPTPYRLQ
ncbi:hypothetical protein AC1031_019548 [Aphanomyces cochlioides]|nr:hypothetical protein AC1031_019548 [Aphanomyces cochlioides]